MATVGVINYTLLYGTGSSLRDNEWLVLQCIGSLL